MSNLLEDVEKWRVDCLKSVENAIEQENLILRSRLSMLVGKTMHIKEWKAVPIPVEIVGQGTSVGYSFWAAAVDYDEWDAQSGVGVELRVRTLPGWKLSEEVIEAELMNFPAKTKKTLDKYRELIRVRSLAIAKRYAEPQEVDISSLK